MSDNWTQRATTGADDSDIFERRKREEALQPAGATETDAPSVYQAHGLAQEGREEEGLTFYHHDGTITVKFYAHLTDIICTSTQHLSLIYMDCVYSLRGRNLHELIPYLKRYKLDAIHCYSAEDYIEPVKGAVIYQIMRRTHAEVSRLGKDSGDEIAARG